MKATSAIPARAGEMGDRAMIEYAKESVRLARCDASPAQNEISFDALEYIDNGF